MRKRGRLKARAFWNRSRLIVSRGSFADYSDDRTRRVGIDQIKCPAMVIGWRHIIDNPEIEVPRLPITRLLT